MDATGDQDLKVQKSSPELIAELRKSLSRFVWKSNKNNGSVSKVTGGVRRLVRTSKTDQLIKLLEPFQEWPQLLDPHLSDLLQPLVSAFVEYLSNHAATYSRKPGTHSSESIIPLPRAICRILYIFCKVRGQKVIVRFLNNEPRYLEPMLDALESWAQPEPFVEESSSTSDFGPMVWEERFVMLWWLSHLMLAPFDLVSMSSESNGKPLGSPPLQLDLPGDTLPIAKRLVHVSTFYIGYASKEREAAGMLLARIALKPDLQTSGLQGILINNAISFLNQGHGAPMFIYVVVGILSFLTKFILSAEGHILRSLTEPICSSVEHLTSNQSPFFDEITSSTLARKLTIKINRAIAVTRIQTGLWKPDLYSDSHYLRDPVEDIIDFLITALEDQDTSVRVAASKALSIITLHLGDMADSGICVDIFSELTSDAYVRKWEDPQTGQTITREDFEAQGIKSFRSLPSSFKPDYGDVNAVKWHGFVLTLSQFMFHGSVRGGPKGSLGNILDIVAHTVHFEQRSSLGISVGANVRDAACFGLWALARRYASSEICAVHYCQAQVETGSRLQSLANDLVVAATLDPAGNIRRGASAALQEMVGRHPDQIKHGIKVVQVIDYHAIALRSKAMLEVAIEASQLDERYWQIILHGLLSWRGVGSPDAQSRRLAAEAIGCLTRNTGERMLNPRSIEKVCNQLRRTPFHKVEVRHGLILALAQVILAMLENVSKAMTICEHGVPLEDVLLRYVSNEEMAALWQVFYFDGMVSLKTGVDEMSFRMEILRSSLRTDPIHEAVCRLISALACSVVPETSIPKDVGPTLEPSAADLEVCIETINLSLGKTDPLVISAASKAAANLFRILDRTSRDELAHKWIELLDTEAPVVRRDRLGVIAALGAVFQYCSNGAVEDPHLIRKGTARTTSHQEITQWLGTVHQDPLPKSPMQNLIMNTLLKQLGSQHSIEQRCATLGSLTLGVLMCRVVTDNILDAVYASLGDYTINEKGDVGSLVRMEAISAVTMLLGKDLLDEDAKRKFIARVCGLAAEKLDKVRWRAWNCLQPYLLTFGLNHEQLDTISDMAQTSSIGYFHMLLTLGSHSWIRKPLLEGYITSAGAGSESLVQATRAALAASIEETEREVCTALMDTIKDTVMQVFMENLTNDRLLIPTMEFLTFLLDTHLLRPLDSEEHLWRSFFRELQQTHYKSANIPKIEAAVKIYAALVEYAPLKKVALKKLCQMLSHPYAKIRNAAAESLFIITQYVDMMAVDWGRRPQELGVHVRKVKARLGVEG